MRRLSRLDRSIDLLRPRSTTPSSLPFFCYACGRHSSSSTSIRQAAQPGSLPYTEKMRRRIWGTDKPPGPEDPYSYPSFREERKDSHDKDQRKAPVRSEDEEIEKSQQDLQTTTGEGLDTYEPAETWDGLVEVGELQAEEYHFKGFLPEDTVTDRYEATAALHRAVVEVFTMTQAGLPLSEISNAGRGIDNTSGVQISLPPSSPSVPILNFLVPASEDLILQSLRLSSPNTTQSEQDLSADQSAEDPLHPEERLNEKEMTEISISAGDDLTEDRLSDTVRSTDYKRRVASWDPVWLKIPLDDLEIKFAIIKRLMQLTGIRIPDSSIKSANTVQALLIHLTKPAQPKTLAEVLAKKGDLLKLPNVKIFQRRLTPIDQEISVGRWKVIEKELQSRGLPITGH